MRRFATYIPSDRFGTDPVPLLEEYAERNAYICKNMFYFTLEPYKKTEKPQEAGSGPFFAFSSCFRHDSMYDNHIPCDALHLLEFSYEQPDHGINCRNKSKILLIF